MYRKVEEEGYIFYLNNVWLDLKILLDRCAKDGSPRLDGECLLRGAAVTKYAVNEKLFHKTGDVDFDTLTEECLEMMCCTCALVVQNQPNHQLPGGKYH